MGAGSGSDPAQLGDEECREQVADALETHQWSVARCLPREIDELICDAGEFTIERLDEHDVAVHRHPLRDTLGRAQPHADAAPGERLQPDERLASVLIARDARERVGLSVKRLAVDVQEVVRCEVSSQQVLRRERVQLEYLRQLGEEWSVTVHRPEREGEPVRAGGPCGAYRR